MSVYAFCSVPVSPVRSEPSDCSEMVTQLLFGEPVEVLGAEQQWRKIRTWFDQYEGWVDEKQLQKIREKELKRWLDGISVELAICRRLKTDQGEMWITRGAFVPSEKVTGFAIGDAKYSFADENSVEFDAPVSFALSYLNAPYLWGGKTPFGIDCSGFVQIVFRAFDINLPRDAAQQADFGAEVDYNDRCAGDLAFFVNDSGKVHHVGILLSPNDIIHASGCVRIDDFSEEGIRRRPEKMLSHKLYCVKRM